MFGRSGRAFVLVLARARARAACASLLLVLFPLGSGACGPVAENPFPIDRLETLSVDEPRYLIQPGDELEIRFFHTPDLDLLIPVRPDGYVSVPFGEEVLAAGRTAEALDRELTERFSAELRSPEITVIVRTFAGRMVHVGGEVDKPGVLPLTASMTVIQSLFEAGGFLQSARLDEVLVMRRGPGGEYVVIPVDLEKAIDGTDPTQNIVLVPFDAVYVPRSTISNVNVWVDLYIRQNIPVNFGIRPDWP